MWIEYNYNEIKIKWIVIYGLFVNSSGIVLKTQFLFLCKYKINKTTSLLELIKFEYIEVV